MNGKIYTLTAMIALMLSGVLAFFDYRLSLGILLATGASLINLLLLSFSLKNMINGKGASLGTAMLSNIVRYGLLAGVIYLAIRNPDTFNIIGVAIGMILFLVALVIDAASRKGGA